MKYNLVVAGGGLSGVAAAVSAAREGLKILLVEKSGCLGGAMVKVLIDCKCENCGIKCCGEAMKEISAEEANKYLENN